MSNQRTSGKLEQLITSSGIYEVLNTLETSLSAFPKSEEMNTDYKIVMEQLTLKKAIEQFKEQLNLLAAHSTR